MDLQSLLNSEIYAWFVLPLLIFIARVLDVSIGTIRILFITKGMKYIAPCLAFFEVMIWLLAIAQIIKNLTNVIYYIAFAGGFAMGTFVGIYIEERISVGMVIIRVITKKDATELIEFFKSEDYGVTSVDAQGVDGQVKIIYAVLRRHDVPDAVEIVKKFDASAFYSTEDIRFVSEKIFPLRQPWYKRKHLNLLKLYKSIRK